MILLFGDKATAKNNSSNKANNVKNNNPVENSGILAMNLNDAKSLLTMGEYDIYVSNSPVAIDYAMYANYEFSDSEGTGFMGEFSAAVAVLGDCGFSSGGFDCGGASFSSCSSGSSCSSFASVC